MRKAVKYAAFMLSMIVLIYTLSACGKKDGSTLTFGTSADFPPFEFITDNGIIDQYDGIDIAIAKQIADENSMKAVIKDMDFESLLDALQNDQIDAVIAGMTVSDKRLEQADFSIPYYTATQVMIVKENSDIFTASDMKGKRICTIQGYTGESCVSSMGYFHASYPSGTDVITKLLNGDCDVVVIDSVTAKKYVQDNPGLKIVEDHDAFGSEEYAIAVKKGNSELLDKINTIIEEKISDGTIADLGIKYTDAAAE